MKNLQLGDIRVRDDDDKGLTGFIRGNKKFWLNQKSEIELMNWLAEKHGRTFEPNIVTTEANRRGWKNKGSSDNV